MHRFILSLRYAFRGIRSALWGENNCRIQSVVAVLVLGASWYLHLSSLEWVMIVLCISLVIGMEMINSAIEKTCDRITRQQDDYVRYVKDVAAGAVLWTSLGSAVAGSIIFLPKIFALFK